MTTYLNYKFEDSEDFVNTFDELHFGVQLSV